MKRIEIEGAYETPKVKVVKIALHNAILIGSIDDSSVKDTIGDSGVE